MSVWLVEIWRAWRASLRRPGFLLLATGVLALGVGASVAVFTLIDQVLLQPLPVPQPSRLLVMGRLEGGHVRRVSPQQYQQLQSLNGVTAVGLAMSGPKVNIAGAGVPELVSATYADRGLLPALGVQMQLGRNFSAEEDRPHGPQAVVLGHGFWVRHYAGNADVIGRSLQVEGRTHTIVGVLPASFDALGQAGDVMLPTALPASSRDSGTNYTAVARLAAGASCAGLAAQVNARLKALDATHGGNAMRTFGVEDYAASLHKGARPVLLLFLASALLVLLIALVNLTNLMLLRALSRNHDAAVRSALGAPWLRLAMPALGEGLLVGLGGTLAGMALAVLGLALLRGFMPAEWLPPGPLPVGANVWALALLIGLLAALLSAGLGLWRGRVATSIGELREGGRSGMGQHSGRLGRLLVVAQMALATALLGVAGLYLHTLYDAARTPLGFASDNILTFELAPVRASYPDAAAMQALSARLQERLQQVPGVSRVAATTNLPSGGYMDQFNMGDLHVPGGEEFNAQYHGVSADFFALFQLILREGRGFSRSDARGGEAVAVVSQSLANRYYGGHALGQLIQRGSGAEAWSARIVGVTADTRQYGPLETPDDMVYLPLTQMPDDVLQLFRDYEPMRFALRGRGDPYGWRSAVRQAVAEVAPNQPIANLRSMRDIVGGTTAGTRLNLLLVGLFAGLALLLASAGMYAVMAVAVAAREREFGVRTTLGASPARLMQLVLRGGLLQIALGLVVGLGLSLMSSGVLRAVLRDIDRSVFDPLAMLLVCVVLTIAGLLACLLPALRAGRVHPMRALRGE